MPICSECGARWDSEEPFCPECSSSETTESEPDSELDDRKGRSGERSRRPVPPPGQEETSKRSDESDPAEDAKPVSAPVRGPASGEAAPAPARASARADDDPAEEIPIDLDVGLEEERPYEEPLIKENGEETREETDREESGDEEQAGDEPVDEEDLETAEDEKTGAGETAAETGKPRVPARPPVLASEALLKDVAPAEPGRTAIRVWSVLLGLAGGTATLFLIGFNGVGIPLAGAFVGIVALGIPSMPYAARAAALLTISACALGVVTWIYLDSTDALTAVIATVGVPVLTAGLLFRSWHRASRLARAIVAAGIVINVVWLGMTGAIDDFTTLDPDWRAWLPVVLRAPLGLVLMLSLLAFMDERSTGGCGAWATLLLVWYGAHLGVEFLTWCWPATAAAFSFQRVPGELAIALVTGPMLAALVAYGLAQLLAVAMAYHKPT